MKIRMKCRNKEEYGQEHGGSLLTKKWNIVFVDYWNGGNAEVTLRFLDEDKAKEFEVNKEYELDISSNA